MAMNSEYRGSYGAVAPKKKTSTRKTVVTPGTKVSQATIDKIKAMGMTKALKGAANASPEMREALKRMYGAKRVAAAGGSSKPAAKSADAARAAANKPASSGGKYVGSRFVPNTPAPKKPSASGAVYKSADAARAAATKTSTTRMGANTVMAAKPTVKAPVKKSGTTDPFARAVFGAGGAIKRALTGGSNQGMTAAQVAAENKRRAAAVAAAKAKKNK